MQYCSKSNLYNLNYGYNYYYKERKPLKNVCNLDNCRSLIEAKYYYFYTDERFFIVEEKDKETLTKLVHFLSYHIILNCFIFIKILLDSFE